MNSDYDKITFEKFEADKEIFEITKIANSAGKGRELYNAKRLDAGVITAKSFRKANKNTATKIENHAAYLAIRVEELRVAREFISNM